MASSPPIEGAVPVPTTDQAPTVIGPAQEAAYGSLLAAIPESGGDGLDGLLARLGAVDHPDDLDAPWRAAGMEAWLNVPLAIQGLRRVESDYAGGLAWFLAVDAAVIPTGELVTFTTGAVMVVAQLAKAYSLGAIPGWRVIPREAARPSKAGYRPQHLEVVRGGSGA